MFIARVGDQGLPRGRIVSGATTVWCQGKPVGLHVSLLINPKLVTVTNTPISHSQTVYAELRPVLISPTGALTVQNLI